MEKNNFEKLILWKKTHTFVLSIYRITKSFPKEEKYVLIDQLRRSSSSIVANIVEGNEKKSKKEYLQYLYNSKGSLAETKYHLLLARDLGYLKKNDYSQLKTDADEIGKLLTGLIHYLSSSIINLPSKQNAFTLLELLIVVTLIVILALAALALFNPFAQIGKGYDARRKHDLAVLQKAMEDYYNDKGCYPKPSEVCYDTPANVCNGRWGNANFYFKSQVCHICGSESGSPSFSPYLSRLPCDPQHKAHRYLYEVGAKTDVKCNLTTSDITADCASWYRVYSDLSITEDASSKESSCYGGGCGLTANTSDQTKLSPYPYGYEYGVASPNMNLNASLDFWGLNPLRVCNSCGGGYDQCVTSGYQQIFVDQSSCCALSPKPGGCP